VVLQVLYTVKLQLLMALSVWSEVLLAMPNCAALHVMTMIRYLISALSTDHTACSSLKVPNLTTSYSLPVCCLLSAKCGRVFELFHSQLLLKLDLVHAFYACLLCCYRTSQIIPHDSLHAGFLLINTTFGPPLCCARAVLYRELQTLERPLRSVHAVVWRA